MQTIKILHTIPLFVYTQHNFERKWKRKEVFILQYFSSHFRKAVVFKTYDSVLTSKMVIKMGLL